MSIRTTIRKMTPGFIKSMVKGSRLEKESKALNALASQPCDTHMLLASRLVNVPAIFQSESIHDSWNQVKGKIEAFDVPDFTGGVNPGDRRAIFYLIRHFQPRSVLEIGTHIGASTINIASALDLNRSNGSDAPFLKTVDIKDVNSASEKPWLEFGAKKSPLEMIQSLGYEEYVEFVTDSSFDYFEKNQETFDFIFLDGDHSAKTVYREVPIALKRLNKNGLILLHDYFPDGLPLWSNKSVIPGPYLATERHIREGADITVIPLGDLPWATKLDSNKTSLALLLKKGE